MRFLSDDLLEGRGTGTRGHEIAARYVAAQFKATGLQPAGVGGSYFQRVPLLEIGRDSRKTSLTLIRPSSVQTLKNDSDFLVFGGNETQPNLSVEASVAFAGFGVAAREEKYDDFAGIDVRGKIIAELYGAPAQFPSTIRAHYGSAKRNARWPRRMVRSGFCFCSRLAMRSGSPGRGWSGRTSFLKCAGSTRMVNQATRTHRSGNRHPQSKRGERSFRGRAAFPRRCFYGSRPGPAGSVPASGDAAQQHRRDAHPIDSPNVVAVMRQI